MHAIFTCSITSCNSARLSRALLASGQSLLFWADLASMACSGWEVGSGGDSTCIGTSPWSCAGLLCSHWSVRWRLAARRALLLRRRLHQLHCHARLFRHRWPSVNDVFLIVLCFQLVYMLLLLLAGHSFLASSKVKTTDQLLSKLTSSLCVQYGSLRQPISGQSPL